MAIPAQKTSAAPAKPTLVSSGPQARKLKKGELLFAEGENSRAMYLLKSGIIRIFKKKGDSNIEIDTIHSGQIIGELAFLDGNPRSASGEALTDCELVEISGPVFQETLGKMPDWLKLLLKTVVGRLRTAGTRIRQLETASSAYDYSDKDGKRSSHYVYLSSSDVMKVAAALLLVAVRNGEKVETGLDVRPALLQRYANQIMGIPVAKITTLMDVFSQIEIISMADAANGGNLTLTDADYLERLIAYMNDENLLEPGKRHDMTVKSFIIMGLINRHLSKYKADPVTGVAEVNVAEVRKLETPAGGKEPFRMDELGELVKLGYITNVNLKSAEEGYSAVKVDSFSRAFRLQRAMMAINAVNEQKRKGGK